ncbi:MAG: DUF4129 domain-containing protein [Candidatus Heimdallarchaeota archaeon]|nr:DUF4129 domain-containing protein [Candidatus Heimdallarchaeota archaeon]MBY8994063.1 DUF4129 domain-containing protein [Candidatus Heimdallarchaeota archaeon]
MSEDSSAERKTESKKKFSLSKLKVDRKFIFITIFLVLSVVALAFSTRYLFDSAIEDWTVTQGLFVGEKGSLHARTPYYNWAYHESNVAYGEWNWKLQYYGSGSASITFIGLNKNTTNNDKTPQGYKLIFQLGQNLAIKRLDSSSSEVELNSTSFAPVARSLYEVKIIRTQNNQTFRVFVNGVLMLNATDSTYTTSEVLELSWSNTQELDWIQVIDAIGANSWSDFFTGLPSADSDNVFTKIALYVPFVTLGLVILLYVFRLLFAEGSWTRFAVPLVLAIIIGLGYGLLVDFLREKLPDIPSFTPISSSDTGPTSTEPYNDTSTGPTPSENQSLPIPSQSNGTGGPGGIFTGVPPRVISNILLGVSGVFIVIAVVFIGIDFFRKRDDEFHERILDKERRWMPTATTTDHRKRVIRAYHKASYDLIDHGAKSERSMTPGEFEETTTDRFELKDKSLEDLTDLYEEARFSEHELSEKESTKAEKSQEKIIKRLDKEQIRTPKETKEAIESSTSADADPKEIRDKDKGKKKDG